nr:hypothetical protein [Tanacetum cinerariifolium]GEY91228.1 hypothetical protein [Tanacetum cinerariifolium]GEY96559.1 hypothetical protein [Tanacetum cinerariifolium]
MHNNIMAAGLRNRPPMLAMGRYAQWQSHFLRYIDTRPNGDTLRKCILQCPYTPSTVTIPAVPVTDDTLAVQYDAEYNVFANDIQHSEQPRSVSNTCVVEKVDSNLNPDSPDMYDNDFQTKQNAVECDDERVALANLIANLKLDSDQEKSIQKIDRLVRSLLIQGLLNDIYSLIDSNKTAKDLWDALERHMLGSEYGEQDRKAVVLYEYETFKATEGELFLDTYIGYLQVINDLKKCGYSKDNYELNFKFLNNLQPEWKQYATIMRQNKNLMDINIDALYNILKQNQGDVNDAMVSKKKTFVITSDPLALIAEKINVSRSKEKVVVYSDSE